ncbi:MAG TPA: DUF2339 domain-containing protein [Candidatus Sulfotelmatobacter sp.]|nr:DUF2339 domain-containing protein [Candidatus Sulfotelmatobacter sp.]
MEVLLYIGFALFVLFGPWILLWRVNSRRQNDRLEDQLRWADITGRIHALERELKEVRATATAQAPTQAPRQEVSTPVAAAATPVQVEPAVPPATATASQAATEAWVTRKTADAPLSVSQPAAPQTPIPSRPVTRPPVTPPPASPPAPMLAAQETGATIFDRFRSSLDIEEMLGTDWLNKVGIVLVVLGVAFFLAYQLKTMGPAGKVLVGFVTSAVLLGAGIWFERGDRYRILARAGIGGGWALLFFTTYAMYHVPAAHVLESQSLDMVLMLAVAGAMVAHTLRYRSQVVTGLSFLLAFVTIAINHSNVYSLAAGAVLAAGVVVIVGRMQWFELEVFGIVASYLNHFLWLRPIIEPMQGRHHPFPEFTASAGILVLYWLIFRVSYVIRQPDEYQERISTAAALLNTSLLLALLKYQSVHPEWAFWALLAVGALETAFGQAPSTRRRRNAVIVLSTLGVVLLIAAFPFRYSGTRLSVLWLAEAEALLLIGVWTKEVVYRRLGMIASVLVAGQMIAYDAAEIFGKRMDDADLRPDYALSVLFVVAAAIFYLNAHWVVRRWAELFTNLFDRTVMQRLSYAGTVMMVIAAWIAFPQAWTAVAWCALGLAVIVAARRLESSELEYQAAFLASIAVVRVLGINLGATEKFQGLTLRLITITLVVALLYVTSRWRTQTDGSWSFEWIAGEGYMWAGSFLLALVAWYELRPVGVAEAWAIVGLVLVEVGLAHQSLSLRLQGYVALFAAFLRIFFVNLNASGLPGEVSPRFYTVVPVMLAFFYAYWRLHEAELSPMETRFRAGEICCWMGTITIGSLMRFELEADWVAAGWAALAFALIVIAWRSGKKLFLYQALLVIAGVLFRTILHNFYERSYFPSPLWANQWITVESRWVIVAITVALLLASLPFAFQIRRKGEPSEESGIVLLLQNLARRPEQPFFFIAVGLLTVLLGIEMRHGMVTLSWGLEGLAVFVLALWVHERSFRLTGLGLLLLCVGKIVVDDVWRLHPRDRYLTFIVLGSALLFVSFLYTRNREAMRRYL